MTTRTTIDIGRMDAVLAKHAAGDQGAMVPLLQDVQAIYNYLPAQAIRAVAEHLRVPLAKAYSVATFYKAFSLKPRGRTIVKLCMGTSCHIRGASIVLDDVKSGLGIGPGETTPDMEYTVEIVNCVGACALAPIVIAGDRYLADVKPGTIVRRLEDARERRTCE
ncbi:MAG: NAD(P)H-dependent oxidoreductase subunit E [Proteobacteria bacterium]|jgi:NADH-quinone oxidoreductase subunit E|nr:NAD(P)H-dependent oxidoreductase subunit E [Pseudomonadota bacterium]